MCCFRALWLVPFIVSAGTVHAQEAPACALSPSDRTVRIRFDPPLETEAAEIYVAPGLSTTVEMPQAIRRKGITLTGAEGRISVMQPRERPNVLVVLAHGPVAPGRTSLAVATVDGKRYPLALATVPGRMDTRVRVEPWTPEEKCPVAVENPVMEVLLQGSEVALRSYTRPEELLRFRLEGGAAPIDPVLLETAFREGNVFYLRIQRQANSDPDKAWRVSGAMLEGSGAEAVKVIDVQWRKVADYDINVIQAEMPEGAPAGYTLTSITLRAEDGSTLTLNRAMVLP